VKQGGRNNGFREVDLISCISNYLENYFSHELVVDVLETVMWRK